MSGTIFQQQEIVRRVKVLFALADQIEARFHAAQAQVAKFTPSLLARAWAHSPPTRSGCALSLREILFARSQALKSAANSSPKTPQTSRPKNCWNESSA